MAQLFRVPYQAHTCLAMTLPCSFLRHPTLPCPRVTTSPYFPHSVHSPVYNEGLCARCPGEHQHAVHADRGQPVIGFWTGTLWSREERLEEARQASSLVTTQLCQTRQFARPKAGCKRLRHTRLTHPAPLPLTLPHPCKEKPEERPTPTQLPHVPTPPHLAQPHHPTYCQHASQDIAPPHLALPAHQSSPPAHSLTPSPHPKTAKAAAEDAARQHRGEEAAETRTARMAAAVADPGLQRNVYAATTAAAKEAGQF